MKKAFLTCLSVLFAALLFAQPKPASTVPMPSLNDKYTEYTKQLDAGKTDIDYKAFRESLLQSAQHKTVTEKSKRLDSLRKRMMVVVYKQDYELLAKLAIEALSIDYTNIYGHKYLMIAHNVVGNKPVSEKHRTIMNGLINSIISSGDGKSCSTAWNVISELEETYILQEVQKMLEEKDKTKMDKKDGNCKIIKAYDMEDNRKTLYFNISKVAKNIN